MRFLLAIALAACVLLAGCAMPWDAKPQISNAVSANAGAAQQECGRDDAWCGALQRCIAQTDECKAAAPEVRDPYGCLTSAGYSWCDFKQVCIHSSENCTIAPAQGAPAEAAKYCGRKYITHVYACGDYVRVTSVLADGGSIIYNKAGTELERCAIAAPESMSGLCNSLVNGNECSEVC